MNLSLPVLAVLSFATLASAEEPCPLDNFVFMSATFETIPASDMGDRLDRIAFHAADGRVAYASRESVGATDCRSLTAADLGLLLPKFVAAMQGDKVLLNQVSRDLIERGFEAVPSGDRWHPSFVRDTGTERVSVSLDLDTVGVAIARVGLEYRGPNGWYPARGWWTSLDALAEITRNYTIFTGDR